MPSSCTARSRPSFCDWLKERSLNFPMSLTSATLTSELDAPPLVVVGSDDSLEPPPQPAATSSAAAPAATSKLLRNTTPIDDVLPKRRAGPQARPSHPACSVS